MTNQPDPMGAAYAAYEQFESRLSTAMDQLVATNGFAEIFTTSATTMMALSRMANGAIDQAVRSTRLAARQDVTSLARQLARTEDKLERVLQAVEELADRVDDLAGSQAAKAPVNGSGNGSSNGTAGAPTRRPAKKAAGSGQ